MVVSPRALDRMTLTSRARVNDEYFTRPYSAESLRWRVEAMLIRAEIPVEGHGPIIESQAERDVPADSRRGQIVIVFNPKGGVGKTTIAVNVAAFLQVRKEQRVLIVDCDTVTGHVASSLGLEHVRTVADAWTEDLSTGAMETFVDIAATHANGMSVLVMAESPLHTEILEPKRVAEAITAARHSYDWVIVDMHPDYGPLNQVIFERADKILVPVTPDVPAIRAAVQFREVAVELDIRERLAMVVNRANSGVSVADMERTVGMPALAEVRSAGMLFVRAANEGRSAVERFPKEKVIEDIEQLVDRMIETRDPGAAKMGSGFLGIFSGARNTNPSQRAS
jgi:pilus assembly protein CpaE